MRRRLAVRPLDAAADRPARGRARGRHRGRHRRQRVDHQGGNVAMAGLNRVLLIMHFLGLAMGLSVPLANMVLRGMIAKATPPERVVLGGFPPLMSRLGRIGLAILWITGVTMVFTKYGGFAGLPWQFNAKLTAVVLLTVTV